MGWDDLFLKINFQCKKCGREFDRMAITKVLDSLDSKVKDPWGTGIDPKCMYHWYDFCLKGSELYK